MKRCLCALSNWNYYTGNFTFHKPSLTTLRNLLLRNKISSKQVMWTWNLSLYHFIALLLSTLTAVPISYSIY